MVIGYDGSCARGKPRIRCCATFVFAVTSLWGCVRSPEGASLDSIGEVAGVDPTVARPSKISAPNGLAGLLFPSGRVLTPYLTVTSLDRFSSGADARMVANVSDMSIHAQREFSNLFRGARGSVDVSGFSAGDRQAIGNAFVMSFYRFSSWQADLERVRSIYSDIPALRRRVSMELVERSAEIEIMGEDRSLSMERHLSTLVVRAMGLIEHGVEVSCSWHIDWKGLIMEYPRTLLHMAELVERRDAYTRVFFGQDGIEGEPWRLMTAREFISKMYSDSVGRNVLFSDALVHLRERFPR